MITGTTTNFNATNAYKIAQKMLDDSASTTSGSSGTGGGFGDLVAKAAQSTIGEVKKAEQVSADAVVGKASLNEVVNSINSADVALKSVIAVRDKVINAYQDIIKMPI